MEHFTKRIIFKNVEFLIIGNNLCALFHSSKRFYSICDLTAKIVEG